MAGEKPQLFKEMVAPLWTSDGHVAKTKERLDDYNNTRKFANKGERNK